MNKKHSVSVADLFGLIDEGYLTELSKELSTDKWTSKLPVTYLFKLILFSLLQSERLSLRVMEANYKEPMFQVLAPALESDTVTWSGLRRRLMNVKVEFFQRLYEHVYQQVAAVYEPEELSNYQLKRHDSTMIASFSHLLEGMKVGNSSFGKTQVKFTTELSGEFLIRMDFHSDQAHLSEETALTESVLKGQWQTGDLHVFDRGLKSRVKFADFEHQNIQFVTRLNEKSKYDVLHPNLAHQGDWDTEELEFIQDCTVNLYKDGGKRVDTEFRLVEYWVKAKGYKILFVTNVWDLSPVEIANIYKTRWDIEVLFRFLKQEMNLSHFVCNDRNAIQVMMYCTMIAAMLVLIYKQKNQIKSYKSAKIKFYKELFYTIMLDILENPDELKRLKQNILKLMKQE